MIEAPVPVEELSRLADLQSLELLDTPPEERFDRLARLATQILDVPIAFLALVDSDRQWFKAKCGIGVDETGRDISFCSHAILQNEPLVVEDAREDERFFDNPLVRGEPYIRFYAGMALQGRGGQNVGTFCIADRRPRKFSQRDETILREFAAIAQRELHLLDALKLQQKLVSTQRDLLQVQNRLSREIEEAAAYVRSLLPERIAGPPVTSDWCFIGSSEVAGDIFGTEQLEGGKLALYLLDVSGHGVGAALHAASIQSAIRHRHLPDTRFDRPSEVLAALNRSFRMTTHAGRFFTMWYGVYDPSSRSLEFASAGHHAALLFEPGEEDAIHLQSRGLVVGAIPEAEFPSVSRPIKPGSRVYLFSDGAFEVTVRSDGRLGIEGLAQLLSAVPRQSDSRVDAVRAEIELLHGSQQFEDDFSLLEFEFA